VAQCIGLEHESNSRGGVSELWSSVAQCIGLEHESNSRGGGGELEVSGSGHSQALGS